MKIEKLELHSNNSACAVEFQLLPGRAPSNLKGNIGIEKLQS
jgi:hypothetical protein